MMKTSFVLAIAMCTIPALPAAAQMAPGQAMPMDPAMTASSPTDYVKMAGAGDLYEKTSSRLVMMSHDAKVRDFAKQMIKDHTTSTMQVKTAARKDHVMAPPPKLMPMQADMIAQLRAAKGPARDQLYMTQQMQAHQMALQLHQGYAANGTAQNLKMAAGMIVPVVQGHLSMLQGMGTGASGM